MKITNINTKACKKVKRGNKTKRSSIPGSTMMLNFTAKYYVEHVAKQTVEEVEENNQTTLETSMNKTSYEIKKERRKQVIEEQVHKEGGKQKYINNSFKRGRR